MCDPIRVEIIQKRPEPSGFDKLIGWVSLAILAVALVLPPPRRSL
jgi:hypothetical protein